MAKGVAVFDAGEDFDLWMHQAFDELARADLTDRPHVHVTTPRHQRANAAQERQPAQQLTYDEFMETRSPDSRDAGRRDSTLAGTHSDSIRGFLNMLVGRPAEGADADDPSGDDGWMELGDEDEDRELDGATRDAEVAADAPDKVEGAAVDAKMFERMVGAYASNITSDKGPLGSSDVLRLRFWLMMLLHKARHAGLPKGLEATVEEMGWPRMALRVIAAFFCGKKPPVTRLMISREYAAMPVDFLECWTTMLWSLEAIDATVAASPRNGQFLMYIQRLRAEVLKMLGLTSSELTSNTVVEMRQALDLTVGTRLGCHIRRNRKGRGSNRHWMKVQWQVGVATLF